MASYNSASGGSQGKKAVDFSHLPDNVTISPGNSQDMLEIRDIDGSDVDVYYEIDVSDSAGQLNGADVKATLGGKTLFDESSVGTDPFTGSVTVSPPATLTYSTQTTGSYDGTFTTQVFKVVPQGAGNGLYYADTATISDSTTHSGLSGTGNTLYSTTLSAPSISLSDCGLFVNLTASGTNASGSGSYPGLGVRLKNSNGDIVYRFNDTGSWDYESPADRPSSNVIVEFSGSQTHTANAMVSGDAPVPVDGQLTVEIYDAEGGGAPSDEVTSCDAWLGVHK